MSSTFACSQIPTIDIYSVHFPHKKQVQNGLRYLLGGWSALGGTVARDGQFVKGTIKIEDT